MQVCWAEFTVEEPEESVNLKPSTRYDLVVDYLISIIRTRNTVANSSSPIFMYAYVNVSI